MVRSIATLLIVCVKKWKLPADCVERSPLLPASQPQQRGHRTGTNNGGGAGHAVWRVLHGSRLM